MMVLINKYYEGVVPAVNESISFKGSGGDEYEYAETEMILLHDELQELCNAILSFDFRGGLRKLMDISSRGNQLLQYNEPWKLIKEDADAVQTIMAVGIQYIVALSVACRPFMPETSDKMRSMLNLDLIKEDGEWNSILEKLAEGEYLLQEGHKIDKAVHLFSRIDDTVIEAQIAKLQSNNPTEKEEKKSNPIKKEIEFDDFAPMDLRTATILEAEKIKKADKLLKLTLDLGFEQRTVVSGIAQHFSPEEVVGKRVTLLANLAPKKLRGVESKGMILMAHGPEGELSFISPPDGWANGMSIS